MHANSPSFSRILLIGFPLEEYNQIQTILIESGHEVSVTQLGTEPLEHNSLDLVILNAPIANPNLTALIQQIRRQQISSFIPILLVKSGDLSELRELEANDFIQSPFNPTSYSIEYKFSLSGNN